jgi:hypothetical protein
MMDSEAQPPRLCVALNAGKPRGVGTRAQLLVHFPKDTAEAAVLHVLGFRLTFALADPILS